MRRSNMQIYTAKVITAATMTQTPPPTPAESPQQRLVGKGSRVPVVSDPVTAGRVTGPVTAGRPSRPLCASRGTRDV